MRNLANQAGKGQYKSKSHSMEFNFNQAAVSKDGLEVHSKMSAFGPDNRKSADNLKSIFILSNSNFSLALPFNIFPDGNFSLWEFTFFPFTITS